jgi:peptidoglycan/LPS O-acetylase OafA/YrhL
MHGLIREAPPGIFSVPCAIVTLLSLIITFVLAAASYYLVERHFIALGHSWKYAFRPSPISSPVSVRPVPIAVDAVTAPAQHQAPRRD